MSGPGTIIPGQTITLQPVNRQTIPYADRPFVDGRGMITRYGYQFLQRLGQGFVSTAQNVGSVVTVVDTITADVSTIQAEIAVIDAEIAAIEAQLTALPTPFPPPIDIVQGSSPAPAVPPYVPIAFDIGGAPPRGPDPIPGFPEVPPAPPLPLAPNMPPLFAAPLPRTSGWQEIGTYSPSSIAAQGCSLPSQFRRFRVTGQSITVSSNGQQIEMQFSTDGGATFLTAANYAFSGVIVDETGTVSGSGSAILTALPVTTGIASAGVGDCVFEIYPGSTSVNPRMLGRSFAPNAAGHYQTFNYGGGWTGTLSFINFLQLFPGAGNFSGTIIVEGLP